MTDNEIIKALECCNRNGSCSKCPYDRATFEHELDCASAMTADALDLINRQRAEIERLEKENHRFADIGKMYSEVRAEAIREFAESVKMAFYYEFDEIIPSIMADRIDDLVKEMTEGTE